MKHFKMKYIYSFFIVFLLAITAYYFIENNNRDVASLESPFLSEILEDSDSSPLGLKTKYYGKYEVRPVHCDPTVLFHFWRDTPVVEPICEKGQPACLFNKFSKFRKAIEIPVCISINEDTKPYFNKVNDQKVLIHKYITPACPPDESDSKINCYY